MRATFVASLLVAALADCHNVACPTVEPSCEGDINNPNPGIVKPQAEWAGCCFNPKLDCAEGGDIDNVPSSRYLKDRVGCWVGPGCTSQSNKNRNNCWNTQKQCQINNPAPPARPPTQSYCFADNNKGGMCVVLQQSPGYYGGATGQCYANERDCWNSLPPAPPAPSADSECQQCLNKGNVLVGKTWCWRDRKCYTTGVFWNPCNNKDCASFSSKSTCVVANGNCVVPS